MTHDRVDGGEIPLTHEFLGYMLGTRQASVSDVLKLLQEDGLLRRGRGLLRVLRENRGHYARLLGGGSAGGPGHE